MDRSQFKTLEEVEHHWKDAAYNQPDGEMAHGLSLVIHSIFEDINRIPSKVSYEEMAARYCENINKAADEIRELKDKLNHEYEVAETWMNRCQEAENQLDAETIIGSAQRDHIADLEKKNRWMAEELHETKKELVRFKRGMFQEMRDVENELAPALGYTYEEEYGWAVGDHTAVSLAMEARRLIKDLEDRETEPGCY